MYVYLQSERNLYTVGHYDPDGEWIAESDHPTTEEAAARVHYLNGGGAMPHRASDRPVLPNDSDPV